MSADRFAVIVREVVRQQAVHAPHLLRAVSARCAQYRCSDGVVRLQVPIHGDSTTRSIARLRAILAGGPSMLPHRVYDPHRAREGFRRSCSALARCGPTIIGIAFPTLAYSGCTTVAPLVSLTLNQAPWVALYRGSWRISGHVSCSTVPVLHYLARIGIPSATIVALLLDALTRATGREWADSVIDLDVARIPPPMPTMTAEKHINRLLSKLDSRPLIDRAVFYAAMGPVTATSSGTILLPCCYKDGGGDPTPYGPLEHPGAPFLSMDFRVIVNGGVCCLEPSLVTTIVARKPTPYRIRLRIESEGPPPQPYPGHGRCAPVVVTAQVWRGAPCGGFFTSHVPIPYLFHFTHYTLYRLLIYPDDDMRVAPTVAAAIRFCP